MTIVTQIKILNMKGYYQYLKDNSNWIKDLNRDENSINRFIDYCKDKYSLKITDHISRFVDNIDLIQNMLNVLK